MGLPLYGTLPYAKAAAQKAAEDARNRSSFDCHSSHSAHIHNIENEVALLRRNRELAQVEAELALDPSNGSFLHLPSFATWRRSFRNTVNQNDGADVVRSRHESPMAAVLSSSRDMARRHVPAATGSAAETVAAQPAMPSTDTAVVPEMTASSSSSSSSSTATRQEEGRRRSFHGRIVANGAGANTGAGVTRPKTEAELEADGRYDEQMEDHYAMMEGGA